MCAVESHAGFQDSSGLSCFPLLSSSTCDQTCWLAEVVSLKTPTHDKTGPKTKQNVVQTGQRSRSRVTHVEVCLGKLYFNLPGLLTLNREQMTTLVCTHKPCPTTHLVWFPLSMQQHLACWRDVTRSQLITDHVWVPQVQVVLCVATDQAVASAQHNQTTNGLFQCLRLPDKAPILCLCAPIVSWCHQQ